VAHFSTVAHQEERECKAQRCTPDCSDHAQQLRAAANRIGLSASKQPFRAAVFPALLHHHVLLLGRRLQPCKQQAASSASRCCARQLRHHGELLLPFHQLLLSTATFDSFASRSLRIA
jgi:hypothetical protein